VKHKVYFRINRDLLEAKIGCYSFDIGKTEFIFGFGDFYGNYSLRMFKAEHTITSVCNPVKDTELRITFI